MFTQRSSSCVTPATSPAMSSTPIAAAAIRICRRRAGAAGAKSMPTKSSGCDTLVTSRRRSQPLMPAQRPQEAHLGQVCLPWEIWGAWDLRDRSREGEVQALARPLHPVIDGGEAPGEYEPSGWTDGHVRLGGAHEFDERVDRQHQLVELGVDIRGFRVEPEGAKETGARGAPQHHSGIGRAPFEHEAITNVRTTGEGEWFEVHALETEPGPGNHGGERV